MRIGGLHNLFRAAAAVLAVIIATHSSCLSAQSAPYKFDIGASLGMSGYLGEANSANLLSHPGFVGDLRFGYIHDCRWTFRSNLSVFSLSGDTRDMGNVLPDNGAFDFKSTVYDLGARVEFNFFNYGIGETYKRLRRWSPYLALGIGACMSSSGGSTAAAFTVPMAFGVKFKASERINLHAEFSMTKAFSHKIDGPDIHDVNGIKKAFYKNTDWYSRFIIGISYEFGKRCETCHYID